MNLIKDIIVYAILGAIQGFSFYDGAGSRIVKAVNWIA